MRRNIVLHSIITLLIGAIFYPLGLHRESMLMMAAFYVGREHAQAEYRWIAEFGHGKRSNMPWWGGFDYRAWDAVSMLDWLAPALMCSAVYFVISF